MVYKEGEKGGVMMGVEFYVICETHIESLWLGKLQFLDSWVQELVEAENINLVRTPTPLQQARRDIKKFRERHNTPECEVFLTNDHTEIYSEPDHSFYRDVDYGAPLMTREQIKQYVIEERDLRIQREYKAMRELEKQGDIIRSCKESVKNG